MGYSFAYNNGSSPSGTTKFAKIQIGGDNQEYTTYGGLKWYASAPYNGKFLIVSDTYSQGWSNQESAKPTFWRSANNTLDSLKDLVNQLPEVNGVTGFTDVGGAINYINSTDKYLISQESDSYPEGDIVTSGLVLNLDTGYSNSYPKSGTTWYDIKETNDGTLTNGPTFNSANGGSIVFDGVDDYTDCGFFDNSKVSSGITLCLWIKLPSYQHRKLLVGNGGGWGAYGFVFFPNSTNTIRFELQGNGKQALDFGGMSFNNEWSFLTGTWESGLDMKAYVNADLKNQTLGITEIQTNGGTSNLQIGGYTGSALKTGYLSAEISIFQIYNRALSAAEVLQNYNAQKGRFGL